MHTNKKKSSAITGDPTNKPDKIMHQIRTVSNKVSNKFWMPMDIIGADAGLAIRDATDLGSAFSFFVLRLQPFAENLRQWYFVLLGNSLQTFAFYFVQSNFIYLFPSHSLLCPQKGYNRFSIAERDSPSGNDRRGNCRLYSSESLRANTYEYNTFVGTSVATKQNAMPSHADMGGAAMSFGIQIVFDGSDHIFEVLTTMAKACSATEIERYEDWIEYQGGQKYPDYRFIAKFKSYLSATTFQVFGNAASGYNRSCLMLFDDLSNKQFTAKALNNSVYLVWAEGTDRYKIGKSTDFKKRLESLQTSCPYLIKHIHTINCVNSTMTEVEAALHVRYHAERIQGEWFVLSKESVDYICSLEVL